ncbi:unnamed protein product [Spirodela intermedia]|uniref:Uncharacterized protein n=1 Tax=Spirodela intermedia TaxID=51605 RepID=A0A7I8K7V6_SPIIN|nr:unnamed protein product [Spirodela intermedia]
METRKNHSVSVTSSSTASSTATGAPAMRELSSRRTLFRCSCSATLPVAGTLSLSPPFRLSRQFKNRKEHLSNP